MRAASGHVLNICIRALDYCPPVDLVFGEYLRALITADADLVPDDKHGYRTAFIEAFRNRDPLAWPAFATAEDVAGLPPTVISVNECDPLRDEGISFYRLLINSGVRARCRQLMGTIHGTEVFPITCPDISHNTASDIANFCAR